MSRFRFFFFLIVCVSSLLGSSIVVFAEQETQDPSGLPYEQLQTFTEIFARIKQDYVETVSDEQLLEDAVRGMLVGLDPHSSYLNEEEYQDLKVGTSGEFGGLGIEVTMEDGFVKVVSPIDDTPAQKAGLLSGDIIVRLDEKPVKGMTLNDAVKIMRGKPGSSLLLTIIRDGESTPLKKTIVRAIISVKSVKFRTLEEGFGYVRISNFQMKTGANLKEAIEALKSENKEGLKGLVLDLRNNPGGVLNAAVEVSDSFLEKGLIVYTQGRIENSALKFNAAPGELLDGAPIVVLINSGSASASEIVAGALQDHKRAVIMGSKSFGKGSVQTIMPTSNGGAVKLTTARYYTPSGRSIQAEGIDPDIVLGRVKLESLEEPAFAPVKESDLSGHLTQGEEKDKQSKDDTDQAKKVTPTVKDYPLNQALTLLKGMNILK
ncbi:MAG: S41 family peptidase [Methylococcales bacterium]|jgi:carboxyl-terminal processing protease|nr:S41 family peptidase [Gammaproteobacteria bacterium]